MDHWQTPVYSIQTYLHPLRRAAKPLRYYLIRICHGLFSHYTIPTVVENGTGARIRTLTFGFGDRRATINTTPTYLVLPAGIEPALPKENAF